MRILGLKPGHDGAVTYIDDGTLVFSLEAEKDSGPRFSELDPKALFDALELAPGLPDIIAIGGWHDYVPGPYSNIRAGYSGLEPGSVGQTRLLGADVQLFTSSHERSHQAEARRLLAGFALELATSTWADHVDVVLVGGTPRTRCAFSLIRGHFRHHHRAVGPRRRHRESVDNGKVLNTSARRSCTLVTSWRANHAE